MFGVGYLRTRVWEVGGEPTRVSNPSKFSLSRFAGPRGRSGRTAQEIHFWFAPESREASVFKEIPFSPPLVSLRVLIPPPQIFTKCFRQTPFIPLSATFLIPPAAALALAGERTEREAAGWVNKQVIIACHWIGVVGGNGGVTVWRPTSLRIEVANYGVFFVPTFLVL